LARARPVAHGRVRAIGLSSDQVALARAGSVRTKDAERVGITAIRVGRKAARTHANTGTTSSRHPLAVGAAGSAGSRGIRGAGAGLTGSLLEVPLAGGVADAIGLVVVAEAAGNGAHTTLHDAVRGAAGVEAQSAACIDADRAIPQAVGVRRAGALRGVPGRAACDASLPSGLGGVPSALGLSLA